MNKGNSNCKEACCIYHPSSCITRQYTETRYHHFNYTNVNINNIFIYAAFRAWRDLLQHNMKSVFNTLTCTRVLRVMNIYHTRTICFTNVKHNSAVVFILAVRRTFRFANIPSLLVRIIFGYSGKQLLVYII